jgi:hypothetical protein
MATAYTGLGGPAGYGENTFSTSSKAAGGNDDGSVYVDATSVFGASGIQFYGATYSGFYVNSNGTITFGSADTSYSTSNLAAEGTPTIAVFWSDVNINSGGEIYWDVDPGTGTITITWDSVAPYSGSGANTFQLRLTSDGSGDFTAEFIYEDIQWAGSGSDLADTGYTDGGSNDTLLDGSGNAGELAAYETNDFGGGDAPGSYTVSFSGGVPATPGPIEGTANGDLIDASYLGDPQGDIVDGGDGDGAAGNEDTIYGYAGNDTISSGEESDFVYGGTGNDLIDGGNAADTLLGDRDNDTILGGDGNDTIDGGTGDDSLSGGTGDDSISGGQTLADQDLSFNWTTAAADGTDVSSGLSMDTGGVTVDVSFTDDTGNATRFETANSTQYVDTAVGETFATDSALYLGGGSTTGDTSTTRVDFTATPGTSFADEVTNVTFRINDLDQSGWEDIVSVRAYDANGTLLTTTMTYQGVVTSGTTPSEDGEGNWSASDAQSSMLVEISGNVSYFEIDYDQAGSSGQALWVTDIHFTALGQTGGDDTLSGGDGNDTLAGYDGHDVFDGGTGADSMLGGDGDDIFTLAEGDTAYGESGDDTFNLVDLAESGASTITIVGGETGETTGDTLDFGGLIDNLGDVTITNPIDVGGGLSGTATLSDGTVVNFSEIETLIVCYTDDTRIDTPRGRVPAGDLCVGDLVETRDHGAQPIRWIGRKTVSGRGKLAPVTIPAGQMGNANTIRVSPQHRMMISDPMAELTYGMAEVFVPAISLVDDHSIRQDELDEVTYIHILLDQHEVIYTEGAASESFLPAAQALCALDEIARASLLAERPDLAEHVANYGPAARPCLTVKEARALFAFGLARAA